MANVKSFSELTAAGKKARLEKYAKQRAQYGLSHGLFRVTGVSDHGEKMVNDRKGNGTHKVHSFGYRIVTAGQKNNEEGLADGTFFWMNEMINVTPKSQKVIDARFDIANKLANGAKSVLVSIDYKKTVKNGTTYRDINSMYERQTKKHAQAQAQPAPEVDPDDLPM